MEYPQHVQNRISSSPYEAGCSDRKASACSTVVKNARSLPLLRLQFIRFSKILRTAAFDQQSPFVHRLLVLMNRKPFPTLRFSRLLQRAKRRID